MSMQLKVGHVTGYQYAGVVTASYNEARMTPTTGPGQLVLATKLEVSPHPWTFRYRDYWGTIVTAFEVHERHEHLRLDATSTVQVNRQPVQAANLGWQELARPALQDQLCEFLESSPRVAPGEELASLVTELRAGATGPTDLARAVCAQVHDEMSYVRASTEVHSTAADAWVERQGVCQDFAHLCIGALRGQGIPARYVSGYLHPSPEPELGDEVTGESHAWIEWWDGTWVAFDPTNQVVPDDRYVIVGAGRDYTDVAPLSGIFSGGDTSSMFVEVRLTRTG